MIFIPYALLLTPILRAREMAKLASSMMMPSLQPTSQGGLLPIAYPSGSNTSCAAQVQDNYLDDNDMTFRTDEYHHHKVTFVKDDHYGV